MTEVVSNSSGPHTDLVKIAWIVLGDMAHHNFIIAITTDPSCRKVFHTIKDVVIYKWF